MSLFAVAAVLRDPDRYNEWMPHVSASKLLGREGEFDFRFYQRLDAPWPVAQRDVVLQVRTLYRPAEGLLIARFEDTTDSRVPAYDTIVRMPRLRGQYRVTALGPTLTEVALVLDADAGGALPDWLIAMVTRDMPRGMIVGLRERAQAFAHSYRKLTTGWKRRYGSPRPTPPRPASRPR